MTRFRLAIHNIDRRFISCAIITVAIVVVYANTLNGGFVLDDEAIFEIGPKKLLDILLGGGARRLADLTFALNFHLHGQSVAGYHLVNCTIHLAASLTLYFLSLSFIQAVRLSSPNSSPAPSTVDEFIPLVTALLFAVHPIQTQAVTYIVQRYTSMATLFYLLAALSFVKARIAIEEGLPRTRVCILVCSATAAGIVALFSKQIAFTLPLMLLMIELLLFRGRLINRRFFIYCGILVGGAAILAALNWRNSSLNDFLFDLHQGTAEDSHVSRTSYLLTQFRVVATYLRLLVLPINQSIFYDYPLYSSLFSFPVAASLALHVCLISLALFLYRRSERKSMVAAQTSSLTLRLAALGIAWFYVTILIESSIFPIRDVIFEHRLYLPSSGIFLTAASGIAWTANRWKRASAVIWAPIAIVCLALGVLTVKRNQVWGDSLRLWEDTVQKAPNQYLASFNLSLEYRERNMLGKALPLLVRALELKPNMNFFIRVTLGETLRDMRLYDESRFTTGAEYLLPDGTVSSYKSASVMYNNLGLAYEHLGDPAKAMTSYEKGVRIDSGYDRAWYNMGLLAAKLGNRDRYQTAAQRLETLNPLLARSLASVLPH